MFYGRLIWRTSVLRLSLCVLLGNGLISLQAGPKTWKAATTGEWHAAANWVEGDYPTDGDDVYITNSGSMVILTNSSEALNTLTLSQTLIFTNWTTALTVINAAIQSGGRMTCPRPFVDGAMSNRVWIVCTNLFIAAGGSIDVTTNGYAGAPTTTSNGNGPGRGTTGSNRGSPGGYGGRGGDTQYKGGTGGAPYGVTAAPLDPGSGGATGDEAPGGHGGGAIKIEAAAIVTVNGSITANGQDTTTLNVGPGSGGAINISCAGFAGTGGVVQARGGNGSSTLTGGGGGGRIAVGYDPATQSGLPTPSVIFSVVGGTGRHYGDLGTVYFPDAQLLTVTPTNFTGQLFGFSAWNPDQLLISNNWLRFPDGFQLTVTGAVKITGSGGRLDLGGNVFLEKAATDEMRGWCVYHNCLTNRTALEIGGSLEITNGAVLYLYAGATNAATADYGARLGVTGDVSVASNSWIYLVANPTNGGAPYCQMANLYLAANGGISADAGGWYGGFGPGKGKTEGGGRPGGGGYGGYGAAGQSATSTGGAYYGSAGAPLDPGSGGGDYGTEYTRGGRGGGLVRLYVTNAVVVDGTISADGESPSANGGGGSGGGINITCRTIAGAGGILRAQGGIADTSYFGGGGGGRIAVNYNPAAQTLVGMPNLRFSALGGIGYHRGDLGTLYFPDGYFLGDAITNLNGQLVNITNWAASSLTLNNNWLRFAADGVQVTITNDLWIEGSAGRLDLGAANGVLWHSNLTNAWHASLYNSCTNRPGLTVGRNLTLTNNAAFYVFSMATNAAFTNHGASVTVGGEMAIGGNSWVVPVGNPTNGGSPLFAVGNLTVAAGSGFNADYRGWWSQSGPGKGVNAGARCGGGGYGGAGGRGSDPGALGGQPYGSSNMPAEVGSGGATYNASQLGGRGGGAVRLVAGDRIMVDGILSARGENGTAGGAEAGGSGGGIYLSCKKFYGAGIVRADAGSANVTYGGGGGGGRIAIWRYPVYHYFDGTLSVTNGTGYSNGLPGTIVLGDYPAFPGTIYTFL